jgi:ferredoxin
VRVHGDLARCEAHGICETLAPEVFQLDDDDVLHYDPRPDEALRSKVEQAIAGCPVQAIRLED